ncbi:hypothetical protein [Pseudomonas sp. MWU12-2345]|uniref:hypothetical protein n=1 Tax=Pseudomonas sp. MWU12-2345 TaxID=2928689 RepID=UPI00200CB7CC|nr:hypothetical protein [Pseudomonas sp. MWU12-2345]
MRKIKRFGLNLLVWLDEGGNTLLLGDPGETISSRSAKAQMAGKRWGCVMCRFLNRLQKDHCKKALEPYAGADAVIPDDQAVK